MAQSAYKHSTCAFKQLYLNHDNDINIDERTINVLYYGSMA